MNKQESRAAAAAAARKPRDATAVLFGLKFVDNILYRFKSSQTLKAMLQSSKHTCAKQNLTQNGHSRSFMFGISGKAHVFCRFRTPLPLSLRIFLLFTAATEPNFLTRNFYRTTEFHNGRTAKRQRKNGDGTVETGHKSRRNDLKRANRKYERTGTNSHTHTCHRLRTERRRRGGQFRIQ